MLTNLYPVWSSPQCPCIPLPWLVEEACGHVVKGRKLSSAMLKRTPQLDSKMGYMVCGGSRVVRARAVYAVDPGSYPARGPLLHVTPPLAIHCQIKVSIPQAAQ